MSPNPPSCPHTNVTATFRLQRFPDQNVAQLEISLVCAECQLPFEFQGGAIGPSPLRPGKSFDSQVMCLPILPSGVEWDGRGVAPNASQIHQEPNTKQ